MDPDVAVSILETEDDENGILLEDALVHGVPGERDEFDLRLDGVVRRIQALPAGDGQQAQKAYFCGP